MTATDSASETLPDEDGPGGRGHGTRRRIVICAVVVAVLVALGTWVVAFSPILGVHTITVTGENRLSEADIVNAARIRSGTPLVRLDTAAAQQRIEALPDVASARVTTSFPSTVHITVVERQPVGVVRSTHPARGFRFVDRTGDQFRYVATRPRGLPLFVVGSGPEARDTGRAVATVAAALPAPLLARIASIQAVAPQAITLVMHSGRVVQWGGADRSALKAQLLPVLLTRRADTIVLSNPDLPYVR